VDVLIFGHFHHPIIEESGVLLLSPGSAIVPGIGALSAIKLDILMSGLFGVSGMCVVILSMEGCEFKTPYFLSFQFHHFSFSGSGFLF